MPMLNNNLSVLHLCVEHTVLGKLGLSLNEDEELDIKLFRGYTGASMSVSSLIKVKLREN